MTLTPENTSNRDPMLHLLGATSDGHSDYVTGMEATGQRQLVSSSVLPVDTMGTDDQFEALGFVFGEPDPSDPLFRPAQLPQGWRKEGSDHSMGSYVLDERGVRRVSVFYKAAYYDRRAHMYVINVGRAAASTAIYSDGPVVIEHLGVLTADELGDARAEAQRYLGEAEEHPDIYGRDGRPDKARQVLALLPETT